MTRHSRSVTSSVKSLLTLLAILCTSLLGLGVLGDQIISDVDDNTLTSRTYALSASNVQDVIPQEFHRGVNIDGTLRDRMLWQLMQFEGNPFPESWNANRVQTGVRLHNGTYDITDIDLFIPASVPWPIGRSYNARQDDDGTHHDSNGYQGRNWFQMSQPELVYVDDAYVGTATEDDRLYLVYGADRFIEFKRVPDPGNEPFADEDTFIAVNGATGVVEIDVIIDAADTATYYDGKGNQMTFFWFDETGSTSPDVPTNKQGQIWTIADTDGNVAYVGHATNKTTALSNGYNSDGTIKEAFDSNSPPNKFTYSYTNYAGIGTKLDKVNVSNDGTDIDYFVEYEYFHSTPVEELAYGDPGNLKLIKITTPEIKAVTGMEPITTYYRYWIGTFHDTDNPGYQYSLQYIVGPEGTRNFDYDPVGPPTWNQNYKTATETILKSYALAYFEYDSSHRIDKSWFNGECGCSGANNGLTEFAYSTNSSYTDNTGYDEEWESRCVVKLPDVSYITQYFDEAGQALSRVISDGDPAAGTPPNYWTTMVDRDDSANKLDGFIESIHSPANVTAYTHSTGAITTSTSAGLVNLFVRYDGTETAPADDAKGYINHWKHEKGTSGSEYLDRTVFYEVIETGAGSGADITRVFNDCIWVYETETTTVVTQCDMASPPSGALQTDFTNVIFTAPGTRLVAEKITTEFPAVTTAKNGSDSPLTRVQEFREDGTLVFTEYQDGSVDYSGIVDGLNSRNVGDADQDNTSDFLSGDGGRMGFGEYGGSDGGNRVITETEFDALGRPEASIIDAYGDLTTEVQRTETYRSLLKDGRTVTLVYPHVNPTTPTYYGPVRYRVTNRAGKVESQGLISLGSEVSPVESVTTPQSSHVDETDDDPITAIDGIGVLSQLTVSVYSETGTELQESHPFFSIPASGDGTDGTHYDATFFGYDDMGRRKRVKDSTGTIQLTLFDKPGRVTEQQIGTNDPDETGTDDMVKIIENEYDSAGVGNSFLTKRTLFIDDSNPAVGHRVTTFAHDVRGRVLLQTNPEEPKNVLNKYDNMGRIIASGQYSTGTVASTDDPTSRSTDRLTLNESVFDELGRVYKSSRWEITQSTGAKVGTPLDALNWYDPRGRLIKTDGSQLRKTRYDRLGRVSHDFILSSDDDSAYTDVYDSTSETTKVNGDIVLQETQNTFDPLDGNLLMVGVIERKSSDISTPTGELDTNADADEYLYTAANVQGRFQITVIWYEDTVFANRLTDTVRYGDNGGSNFDLEAVAGGVFDQIAVPARSDTALLTERAFYTEHALVKDIIDPMNRTQRTEYDDAGRRIKTIANYVNGTPSGATGDDDVHTRFVYTDGLQTKIFVDVNGDNVEDAGVDEITTYTFGTNKGASAGDSKIGTGHLLQKVQYPESSGGTDVVTFAYNGQSQQIWTKDQEGNVIETDYDDLGREEHRRITTLASGFDGAIRRITTAYVDRGFRDTVTQYDNATVGSGTVKDEVKFTYDGWGNLTKYQQDDDGTVDALPVPNATSVSYTYAKATGGRNTLRRTSMTHPDGTQVDYVYDSASSNDDAASRVSQLKISSTSYVQYDYRGVGSLVRIDYPESDLFMTTDSSTYIDRFNRVIKSRWTKDLSSDLHFYEFDITYDRNSNITVTEDNIFTPSLTGVVGFDVSYTVDGLNRLSKAEEGDWTGSISTRARQQIWTLDQIGNWDVVQWDENGDNDFIDAGEYDDDRVHNVANELTGRLINSRGYPTYNLIYDKVGNLIDDGENYEYEYDPFGRLRKIKNTSTQVLVAEYTYNGMNHRIAYHEDVDNDGDLDNFDAWFHNTYNERWQLLAVHNEEDLAGDPTDPKEQFIYHNAGLDGTGGSSYIDNVVLRDKDANTAWGSQSDGVREERRYYCHNWRNDIIAVLTDLGAMEEWAKYSSYGRPYGISVGDSNADAVVDSVDNLFLVNSWGTTTQATVTVDTNLDGNIDGTDSNLQVAKWGAQLGWDSLSNIGNRKGYAGYELDDALTAAAILYHVRNRVLHADLGRWLRRDPLGYVDGWNLYAALRNMPMIGNDPDGQIIGCLIVGGIALVLVFGGPSGCSKAPAPPAPAPGPAPVPCPPPVPGVVNCCDGVGRTQPGVTCFPWGWKPTFKLEDCTLYCNGKFLPLSDGRRLCYKKCGLLDLKSEPRYKPNDDIPDPA